MIVYFFFLLILNDDCKLSQFLEQFNPSRHERGIIEIKDPQFVELSSTYDDYAKVVFFFTNDTTHGISYRSLPDSTSFYYSFVPFHKKKEIIIDTLKCAIREERDLFVRPISSHVYQYLYLKYDYKHLDSGQVPLLLYGIRFIPPHTTISAHGIPQPEGWFELNVDSLFLENRSPVDGTIFDESNRRADKNDLLFGRYISRYRHRSKELNIHQADSILQSWGFDGFNENAFQ